MKRYHKHYRIFTFIAAFVLAISLTACGVTGSNSGSQQAPISSAPSGSLETNANSSNSSNSTSGTRDDIDLSGVTLRIAAASASNGQGLIEAAGLDDTPYTVDFTVMQGGNLVMEALAADQIDLGTGSQIPPINASQAANGGNFKIIGIRRMHTLDQELILPPNSSITSVAELKGKTVGYVKNTTAHYFLSKMLEAAGLEWDEVNAVALTTSDGLSAVLTGEVDALASYGNAVRSAKSKGSTLLESAANILTGDYYWYATPTAIQDPAYHAAIVDWLNRYNEAAEWARQNPEEYAAYYSSLTGEDETEVYENFLLQEAQKKLSVLPISDYDYATIASEQDIADTFYKLGLFENRIDVSGIFDDSFSEELSTFPRY